MDQKWSNRLVKNFKDHFVSVKYNWDTAWTVSRPTFQNQYFLRDFQYSEKSFSGFLESGVEEERIIPHRRENYWENLEESFLNDKYVKYCFKEPKKAWDTTTLPNQDGSLPIIEGLTQLAGKLDKNIKLLYDTRVLHETLIKELHKHYHDKESDNAILTKMKEAGRIKLELDAALDHDKYFFGKFMKKFIIRDGVVFNLFREKLANIERIEVADPKRYTTILASNPGITPHRDFHGENIRILMDYYKFTDITEFEDFCKDRKIDLHELFYGETKRIRSNSSFLAENLVSYWIENHLSEENFREFYEESGGLSQGAVKGITDILRVQFEYFELEKYIGRKIRQYVDHYYQIDIIVMMIADIASAVINNFINTVGYDFYPADRIEELKKTSQENKLNLNFNLDSHTEAIDEESLTRLLDTMDQLEELINETPLKVDLIRQIPSFSHFKKWSEQLELSFLNTQNIPTYDILANNELGEILENFKTANLN